MVTPPKGAASRFLNLPHGRMHCWEAGQGDTVLCLHGNPTHVYFYRSLFPLLAPRRHVVAIDHLGCGQSDLPDPASYGYRLEDRTADLQAALAQLPCSSKLTLILHDWGGMIGLLYAVRHPERIGRIILMNTAGFPLPEGKSLPWSLRLCRLPGLGAFLVRGMNLFCLGAVRNCVTRKPLDPEARAAYLAPYGNWGRRLAVHQFVLDIPLTSEHPTMAGVQEVALGLEKLRAVPTLVCWGLKDFVFDADFLAEWRRRCPWATVQEYPDAGHWLLEDEAEAVPHRILSFLDDHPLGP